MAVGIWAHAQGGDAAGILAATRRALGGDAKLEANKSLTATGRNDRGDVEVAIELPDKFIRKDVFAQIGDTTLSRTLGFNGAGLIDEADAPQVSGPGGGNMVIRMAGPGMPGGVSSAAAKVNTLTTAKREFARLALGIFASSFSAYPLHLTAAGQADSPDGKADVLDVTSDDGFTGRLFVSAQTHLPVMLTWMDKEPLIVTIGGPAGGGRAGAPIAAGGNAIVTAGSGGGVFTQPVPAGRGPMTPEERDKMIEEAQARAREAEANRRMVEFRVSYGDYKDVDGVKVPFTITRTVDGKAQDALTIEKVRINPRIDPRKFEVSK
jgi:hypothetical protein